MKLHMHFFAVIHYNSELKCHVIYAVSYMFVKLLSNLLYTNLTYHIYKV